jgi:hypothetical protein
MEIGDKRKLQHAQARNVLAVKVVAYQKEMVSFFGCFLFV